MLIQIIYIILISFYRIVNSETYENNSNNNLVLSRQILLMSSLIGNGNQLLKNTRQHIDGLLKTNNVSTILFIPYASLHHDFSTEHFRDIFLNWGYEVEGIHRKTNQIDAIEKAQAIFVCGGNTFVLLKHLYDKKLIEPIRQRVLEFGIPYIGTSAGANIATRSIHTTNDMPVTYPPSLSALNLVPFNINPHYIEPNPNRSIRSETRDHRLYEFMHYNNLPVLCLREGNILYVNGNTMKLVGQNNMKYFKNKSRSKEYSQLSDLSFIL